MLNDIDFIYIHTCKYIHILSKHISKTFLQRYILSLSLIKMPHIDSTSIPDILVQTSLFPFVVHVARRLAKNLKLMSK